jgi:hypothetical protein
MPDDASTPDDSGLQPDASMPADAGTLGDGAPIAGGGAILTGSADGTHQYTAPIANAWWIQKPDMPAGGAPVSTVLYIFSNPVPCSKLNVTGWDQTNEPPDTMNVEIKAHWSGTTSPMPPPAVSYPVVPLGNITGTLPPAGSAWVFFQVVPHTLPGTPTEITAQSGTVTLDTLTPMVHVTGSFSGTWVGGHTLMGSFDAAYCPNGQEP